MNQAKRFAVGIAITSLLLGTSVLLKAQDSGTSYTLLMGKQSVQGKLSESYCDGALFGNGYCTGRFVTGEGIEFKDQDTGVWMAVNGGIFRLSISAVRFETGSCKGRPIAKLTLLHGQSFTGCVSGSEPGYSALFIAGSITIDLLAPGGKMAIIPNEPGPSTVPATSAGPGQATSGSQATSSAQQQEVPLKTRQQVITAKGYDFGATKQQAAENARYVGFYSFQSECDRLADQGIHASTKASPGRLTNYETTDVECHKNRHAQHPWICVASVKGTCSWNEFASSVGTIGAVSTPIRTEATASENEAQSAAAAISQIHNGPHTALPAPQVVGTAQGGETLTTITNRTSYTLSVYFSGPSPYVLQIQQGQARQVQLSPGQYQVGARVSDPSVIPFYGVHNYNAGTRYSEDFYIQSRVR